MVVKLIKAVDNPHFGTLPDFGNINPGDDNAEVIRKIVPYANGISVKTAWQADGTHPWWDLEKIIRIGQDSGYHGFWGIESSYGWKGERPSLGQARRHLVTLCTVYPCAIFGRTDPAIIGLR